MTEIHPAHEKARHRLAFGLASKLEQLRPDWSGDRLADAVRNDTVWQALWPSVRRIEPSMATRLATIVVLRQGGSSSLNDRTQPTSKDTP